MMDIEEYPVKSPRQMAFETYRDALHAEDIVAWGMFQNFVIALQVRGLDEAGALEVACMFLVKWPR